ncbi:hypothetical protein EGW08_006134 [Elysia chlorotica]|uniref:G-protein coupled receptors family 1 profile domain-containing protein n=1 Tax=Elysia chlorotica TaxID=188477 RepID=A0A433TWY6_ELYCH|nr:hypothetical protein EGW08_006134 [Elysia chlorotica]
MNVTGFGDAASLPSSSSPHSSLNDTWAYFLGLSNREKLQLMEKLRSLGISEDDLNLLYKHFGSEGDDLRYLHIPEFRAHKALILWVPPVLLLLGTMGNTCRSQQREDGITLADINVYNVTWAFLNEAPAALDSFPLLKEFHHKKPVRTLLNMNEIAKVAALCFAVLRQKTMRQQSIYMYLCALAVFDSLVLYVGLLRLWIGEITGTDIRNISPWVCKITLMLGYTCSDISVWLIVAVTVERYIVVCHPLRARAFCQQRRAKIIIAGTVLVFGLINIHFLFSTSLVDKSTVAPGPALSSVSQDDQMARTCGPLPGYGALVIVVWPWVDAILYGLGPFLLITVLNTVIIFKIFRANSSRAALTNGARSKSRTKIQRGPDGAVDADLRFSSTWLSLFVENSDNFSPILLKAQKFSVAVGVTRSSQKRDATAGSLRMTVMLLTVSFTFMLTTLPMTVSNIIANTVINTSHRTDQTVAQGLLVHTLALLLMYLNHSVNFLLYCVTGRKFRKVITRMYSGKMCTLNQRKSTESNPLDHSEHLYCSRGNISRQS